MAISIDGMTLKEFLSRPVPESMVMPNLTVEDMDPGEGPFWVYLTNKITGADFIKKFHSPYEQERFVNKVKDNRSQKVHYRFKEDQPHWC